MLNTFGQLPAEFMAGKFYKLFFPQRMEHCPRPLVSLLDMGSHIRYADSSPAQSHQGELKSAARGADPAFVSFVQQLLQVRECIV
jgi:hypothetical protein